MLQRIFRIFIRRTHFWRTINVSEMAELYSSRVMRVMAMQMFGGFGIVYLYQLGYSLHWLACYYTIYFASRVLMAPFIAVVVARYGPKHGTLISNILFIGAAITLAMVPHWGIIALILLVPLGGFSRSLYDVCYLVDFSKVKHVDHAGKELGLMQIIEKVITALSPIIGGFIALIFGPAMMIVAAAVLMLLSALPLFFTSEPVKIRQKLTLQHFNFKVTWKPLLAHIAAGVDMNASGIIWNLFIVIVVFGTVSNASYIQIGILSSVALLASIIISYSYGKLVDGFKGRGLLKFGSIGNTAVYLLRPFVSTPLHVAGVNIANEIVTTGYTLPALRGIFDTADGLPGYRITYITLIATMLVVGDTISMSTLAILTLFTGEAQSLKAVYFIVAPVMLLIMLHGPAIYRRGVLTRFIHRV